MAKHRIIYIFSLIAALIFYIDYDGWISAYSLVLVLVIPVLSLLLSIPSVRNVRLNVSVRKVCARHEDNDIDFSVGRRWLGFSPLCKLEAAVLDLLSGKRIKYEVTAARGVVSSVPLNTEHCGVIECALSKAYVYDFLCLFRFRMKAPEKISITVAPSPVRPIPTPDMAGFNARVLRPKAGGGFSEIHETREYRAGDPLNSVHWKLSAKTDDLIIREAMVPERLVVVVSLDLTGDRNRYDMILDRLRWVCEELIERNVSHEVRYLGAADGAMCAVTVENGEELRGLLEAFMSTPVTAERPSIASRSFNDADWRYHVSLPGGDAG